MVERSPLARRERRNRALSVVFRATERAGDPKGIGTGLCTVLIEEAARPRVPSIVIEVKGELLNLRLTFPSFEPSLLEPWLELEREGMSPEQIAAQAGQAPSRLPLRRRTKQACSSGRSTRARLHHPAKIGAALAA
jgi:hypothetical protein